jgi:hypothetical protein
LVNDFLLRKSKQRTSEMSLISNSMVAVRIPSMRDTARENGRPANGKLPGQGEAATEVACGVLAQQKKGEAPKCFAPIILTL